MICQPVRTVLCGLVLITAVLSAKPGLATMFFNPIIGKFIVCSQEGLCQYLTLRQGRRHLQMPRLGHLQKRGQWGSDTEDMMPRQDKKYLMPRQDIEDMMPRPDIEDIMPRPDIEDILPRPDLEEMVSRQDIEDKMPRPDLEEMVSRPDDIKDISEHINDDIEDTEEEAVMARPKKELIWSRLYRLPWWRH